MNYQTEDMGGRSLADNYVTSPSPALGQGMQSSQAMADQYNQWLAQNAPKGGGSFMDFITHDALSTDALKNYAAMAAMMFGVPAAAGAAGGAGTMAGAAAGGAVAGGANAQLMGQPVGQGALLGAAGGAGGSAMNGMMTPEVANSGSDFGGQGVGWSPDQMGGMASQEAQSFPISNPQQGMQSMPMSANPPMGQPFQIAQGGGMPQTDTNISGLSNMTNSSTPDFSNVDFNKIFDSGSNGVTNLPSAPAPAPMNAGTPDLTGQQLAPQQQTASTGSTMPQLPQGSGQLAAGSLVAGSASQFDPASDPNTNTNQGPANPNVSSIDPITGTPYETGTGSGGGNSQSGSGGLSDFLGQLGLGGSSGFAQQQGGMNIPGMIGSGMEFAGAQQYRKQLLDLMQQAVNKSDPFASQRGQYQQQFQQYNTNPNFFQNDSVMQGLQNSALRNVESRDATRGYLGSGNMLMDSIRQSNETAAPYMLARGNQLGQAAGMNANPAAAGQVMSSISPLIAGASNQSMGALGSLMQYGLGAQTGANGSPQGGGMNLSGLGNMVSGGIKSIFGE